MIQTKTKRRFSRSIVLLFTISFCTSTYSQSRIDSIINKLDPQKFAASIIKKTQKLEDMLVAKSMKVLNRLQSQEEKIHRNMLATKDSLQGKAALADIRTKYKTLQSKLMIPAIATVAKQYIPYLDTLSTALKFLDQNGIGRNIKNAIGNATSLQDKFQQAEEIRKFIRERKEELKEQLDKLGLIKQLNRFNKQVYYYTEQLKEYREILKNPKRRERKTLELLSKTKFFRDFMSKNSMLASLFRMPGDPNDPDYTASLSDLQTRVEVNNLIQKQIAAGGPNGMQQFQQNVQAAQAQLNLLKDKALKFGGSSSEDIMPEGFKPNNQKTKSFLQRFEYGTNVQTQPARNYFPVTSDIGLFLGYKPNDKSVMGIGASYKLGWGTGWKNIKLTQQGVGIRSYVDWKMKGNLWLSGGFEMNYHTLFNSIDQLRNYSAWKQSGLLGLSKTLELKSKLFKKTKLMLLWDFLSYRQIPRTQPLIFRIAYNVK